MSHFRDKLDNFHYHEAMDRTAMICDMIDTFLIQHPVSKAEKEFAEKLEEANMQLVEAYQIIGKLSLNKEKSYDK
jgi:hypothetical protein